MDQGVAYCINGINSEWGPVTSGVSQGSGFSIIHHVHKCFSIDSTVSKFVDDIKIGRIISIIIRRMLVKSVFNSGACSFLKLSIGKLV